MMAAIKKQLRGDFTMIALIMLLSILFQVLFLQPPILSDQMEYYDTATRFPRLPDQPNHWSLRIGLILPVAVLYRIFGQAEITYYFLPFISMLFIPVGVFLLGKRLFNRRVGLVSALWIMLMPSLLLEISHLLPDVPATACVLAGFALLAAAGGSAAAQKKAIGGKKEFLRFLLAGLFFGWAYLIKEYYALLFLLIPLAFWAFNIRLGNLFPLALGMLLMFGIEAALGMIYYSNPLVRLSTALPRETWGVIEKNVLRIIKYFPVLLGRKNGAGTVVLGVAALFFLVSSAIHKDRRHIFLLAWIVLVYCFFTLVSLLPVMFSWEDIVLLRIHKFRYWVLILPPLVIAGVAAVENFLAAGLRKLIQNPEQTNSLTGLGMLLMLVASASAGVSAVIGDPNLVRNGADHYLELREYLEENDNSNEVLWINRDSKVAFERILPMYTNDFMGNEVWDGRIQYLNTGQQYLREEEITDGEVIIDRYFFNSQDASLPTYLLHPPADWDLVFESENHELAIFSAE